MARAARSSSGPENDGGVRLFRSGHHRGPKQQAGTGVQAHRPGWLGVGSGTTSDRSLLKCPAVRRCRYGVRPAFCFSDAAFQGCFSLPALSAFQPRRPRFVMARYTVLGDGVTSASVLRSQELGVNLIAIDAQPPLGAPVAAQYTRRPVDFSTCWGDQPCCCGTRTVAQSHCCRGTELGNTCQKVAPVGCWSAKPGPQPWELGRIARFCSRANGRTGAAIQELPQLGEHNCDTVVCHEYCVASIRLQV